MYLQLLILQNPLQIHVHHGIDRRMPLHLAYDGRLSLRIDIDADDRGIESLVIDHRQQLLMIERDIARLAVAAIKNRWDFTGTTQAAARTFALIVTRVRAHLKRNTHFHTPDSPQLRTRTATSAPPPFKIESKEINRYRASSPTPRRGCGGSSRPAATPPTAGGCADIRAPRPTTPPYR